MNDKTRKAIESHIEKIIEDYRFFHRQAESPNECVCYMQNKPCHTLSSKEFNCFLCYCPEYDTSKPEGGCKIQRKEGKWFDNPNVPTGKIWDCSNCDYPNKENTVRNYLKNLFGLVDKTG